jgi:adenylate kinase family enzyme
MRVSVVGCSGAGKTTFGKRLAARLGCPFVELDSIYHQPNWTSLADDAFRSRVETELSSDDWVCDGNYPAVHPIVCARATDAVWLDPPKGVVMAQVVWRSVVCAAMRVELWNGNRESVAHWLDPEHPIRWAWSTFEERRVDYEARMTQPEYAHLRFHRLRTRRAMRAFVEASLLSQAPGKNRLGQGPKALQEAQASRPRPSTNSAIGRGLRGARALKQPTVNDRDGTGRAHVT